MSSFPFFALASCAEESVVRANINAVDRAVEMERDSKVVLNTDVEPIGNEVNTVIRSIINEDD